MISEERKKALDIAMAQIEKNFGKGALLYYRFSVWLKGIFY